MSRLIDADALKATMIEALEQIKANPKMNGQEMHIIAGIAMLGEMIDDSPTIDAVPVVRGEWLEFVGSAYHGVDDDGEVKWRDVSIFHCDKCGRKTVVKENFCPNCGADMREEDEHETTDR